VVATASVATAQRGSRASQVKQWTAADVDRARRLGVDVSAELYTQKLRHALEGLDSDGGQARFRARVDICCAASQWSVCQRAALSSMPAQARLSALLDTRPATASPRHRRSPPRGRPGKEEELIESLSQVRLLQAAMVWSPSARFAHLLLCAQTLSGAEQIASALSGAACAPKGSWLATEEQAARLLPLDSSEAEHMTLRIRAFSPAPPSEQPSTPCEASGSAALSTSERDLPGKPLQDVLQESAELQTRAMQVEAISDALTHSLAEVRPVASAPRGLDPWCYTTFHA